MGKSSTKNLTRAVQTVANIDFLNQISKDKIPYLDKNNNFHWDMTSKEKEKYFPVIFNLQKEKIENLAKKIIEKHTDKNLLTSDDVNNFIKNRLIKNGLGVNGVDYPIPNPVLSKKEYDILLKNKNANILESFLKETPDNVYKYMYGMAKGRERLNKKVQQLSNGEKVYVTDFDQNKTNWLYKNKYLMYKSVKDSNGIKHKAFIMPAKSNNTKNVTGNLDEKRSERMKLVVTNFAGTKVLFEKYLRDFNTDTTGSHAAMVNESNPTLISAGYT